MFARLIEEGLMRVKELKALIEEGKRKWLKPCWHPAGVPLCQHHCGVHSDCEKVLDKVDGHISLFNLDALFIKLLLPTSLPAH